MNTFRKFILLSSSKKTTVACFLVSLQKAWGCLEHVMQRINSICWYGKIAPQKWYMATFRDLMILSCDIFFGILWYSVVIYFSGSYDTQLWYIFFGILWYSVVTYFSGSYNTQLWYIFFGILWYSVVIYFSGSYNTQLWCMWVSYFSGSHNTQS